MGHVVAYKLLTAELAGYRQLSYEELRQLVGERTSRLVRGSNAIDYDLTVVVQAGKRDDEIRVTGFIGEANWGGPHDTLDEVFLVKESSQPHTSGTVPQNPPTTQ
jgi:hypothetical protein